MKSNQEIEKLNNEQVVMEIQEAKLYLKKLQNVLKYRVTQDYKMYDW